MRGAIYREAWGYVWEREGGLCFSPFLALQHSILKCLFPSPAHFWLQSLQYVRLIDCKQYSLFTVALLTHYRCWPMWGDQEKVGSCDSTATSPIPTCALWSATPVDHLSKVFIPDEPSAQTAEKIKWCVYELWLVPRDSWAWNDTMHTEMEHK